MVASLKKNGSQINITKYIMVILEIGPLRGLKEVGKNNIFSLKLPALS